MEITKQKIDDMYFALPSHVRQHLSAVMEIHNELNELNRFSAVDLSDIMEKLKIACHEMQEKLIEIEKTEEIFYSKKGE